MTKWCHLCPSWRRRKEPNMITQVSISVIHWGSPSCHCALVSDTFEVLFSNTILHQHFLRSLGKFKLCKHWEGQLFRWISCCSEESCSRESHVLPVCPDSKRNYYLLWKEEGPSFISLRSFGWPGTHCRTGWPWAHRDPPVAAFRVATYCQQGTPQ